MATKTIAWNNGTGNITATYDGSGNGQITIKSDANNLYEQRSQQITVKTTDGSKQVTLSVVQAAKARIDLSTAVVTASNQTYNGSAKTPTPTVTLNGNTVPSTGYDVSYSNNTNAGTATITITGKGEYTGTATGTFSIAKASRTLSFSNSYMVLAPSGNGTNVATPSAGSGDGTISYSSSNTSKATVNSSGNVTAKTSEGSVTITATVAEGTNYLSASASYTTYIFNTTHNFDYTGSVQSLSLPPGTYKLQCWGAQGGTNSRGATGGNGGYSEGQLTISAAKTVYVFVGGKPATSAQGGSNNGGWNGGGGGTAFTSKTSGDTLGDCSVGCGGGATDIALTTSTMSYSSYRTNRSAASYLSRMIVAGGGSGGSYGRKRVTTTTTTTTATYNKSDLNLQTIAYDGSSNVLFDTRSPYSTAAFIDVRSLRGQQCVCSGGETYWNEWLNCASVNIGDTVTFCSSRYYRNDNTVPADATYLMVRGGMGSAYPDIAPDSIEFQETTSTTDETHNYRAGYPGGGTNGAGYSSSYYGKPNGAGNGGGFGYGANLQTTSNMFSGGCGGGGWYGGGNGYTDGDFDGVRWMGGGSGFVNTYANRSYRPSGYTGLELDSGTTYAGNTSFPSTGGGTETGHSGNGYARITRLE